MARGFPTWSAVLGAAVAVVRVSVGAAPTPPAFPGAEGFGAQTPGGRGGPVFIVRTLADDGPGSFRDAVRQRGPRTIVFAVGGLITLTSPVDIREPYLTIAGQTAPGDGICFRGNQVSIRTHDVVVRHLRFRPGDIAHAEVDGLDVMEDSRDVIIDHCSASWAVDENLSASGGIRNVTIQWSLIAEGLNRSVHSKGPHGYGSLVRAVGGVSLHHNLWAHNSARNPRLGDNYGHPPWPVFDVRNNVVYDYGEMASGMTGDRLDANYIGNYIRPGPSSDKRRGAIVLTDTASAAFFVHGNVFEGRNLPPTTAGGLFDRLRANNRALVSIRTRPFAAPLVTTTDAEAAYRAVLAGAGATRPARDAVDTRIVQQVARRGGSVIDSPAQVGGWPEYRSGDAPADQDADGIADEWERTHGLDPRSAADSSRRGADGYTHLERYLNELGSAHPAQGAVPRRSR